MSFTAEVKDELSRSEPACPLCNRAMLSAIVHIEGTLNISGSGRYRLEIATETPAVARTVVRLLHTEFNLKTEVTTRRSVLHKTYNYLITVPGQPRLAKALEELGIIDPDSAVECGATSLDIPGKGKVFGAAQRHRGDGGRAFPAE